MVQFEIPQNITRQFTSTHVCANVAHTVFKLINAKKKKKYGITHK